MGFGDNITPNGPGLGLVPNFGAAVQLPSFPSGGPTADSGPSFGLIGSIPISALNPTATANQYYLPTRTQTAGPLGLNFSQIAGPGNQANSSLFGGLGSSKGGGGGGGGSNYANVTNAPTLVPPNFPGYNPPTFTNEVQNAPAFTPLQSTLKGIVSGNESSPYAQLLGQAPSGAGSSLLPAIMAAGDSHPPQPQVAPIIPGSGGDNSQGISPVQQAMQSLSGGAMA